MLSLNYWWNWDTLTNHKLSLIVELIDVIENYCKKSKIIK